MKQESFTSVFSKIFIFLSVVIFVFATFLIYSQIRLHSDILFLNELYRDIFLNNGNWSDWKLTPAPAYFPDMALYFIGSYIFEFAEQRIMFVLFLQAVLLLTTLIWLLKHLERSVSSNGIVAIILILTFVTLVIVKSDMWFYFNTANNHYSTLLLSLFLLGLILKFLSNTSYVLGLSIVLVGIIAKISSATFLIEFLFPALLMIGTILYMIRHDAHPEIKRKILILLLLLMSVLILGNIIEVLITFNNPMHGRTTISIDSVANSVRMFLLAIKNAFLLNNYYTFTLSVIALMSILLILVHTFSRMKLVLEYKIATYEVTLKDRLNLNRWKIDLTVIFWLYSVSISIIGSIASGGFIDLYCFRYYMFPIALSILICIVWLEKLNTKIYKLASIIFFISLAFMVIKIYSNFLEKGNVFDHNKYIDSGASKCMKEIMNKNKVHFASGISDYWMARSTSYGINHEVEIEPITNNLQPFFWMNSIGALVYPDNYKERFYNFVIIRKNEGDPFNFNSKSVGSLLPIGDNIFSCEEVGVDIWYYQGGELDSLIKNTQSVFLFKGKYSTHARFSGNMFPGTTGAVDGFSRGADSNKNQSGFLVYGPYIDLEEGSYTITLNYSSNAGEKLFNGLFEIGRFDLPHLTNKVSAYELKNGENQVLTFDVNIGKGGLKRMEMRIFYNGFGKLSVHEMSIMKNKPLNYKKSLDN